MRVLIIEDDVDIRDFLKRAFEARCATVEATADGEKGLFMAKANEYDIILLDHILPKKNGLQICKELRASGKTTPVIVTTVKTDTDHKVNMLNCGADDYLSKPYPLEELFARVHAVMRRPKSVHPAHYSIGDLHVDCSKQIVTRGKKELYLTRKEFALLEYLIKRKDTVVSRGVLMEQVWNREDDPFSNTLEAHILNLRKKIEKKGKTKLLHNIPGRGYIISDSRSDLLNGGK